MVGRFVGQRLGPRALLDHLIPTGPHGAGWIPGGKGLTLKRLEAEPHGIDLGPLEPRLPGRLYTKDQRLQLAPDCFLADLGRLEQRLGEVSAAGEDNSLYLIGRRQLRSNNSWMHNSERLVKGKDRCTLLMHSSDAKRHGLETGQQVKISSRVGAVTAPLEVSDEVMPGVVSLPHGWGHDRPGIQLRVAQAHPGVSLNDLTDEGRIDTLTGAAQLNGVPVSVEASVAPRP